MSAKALYYNGGRLEQIGDLLSDTLNVASSVVVLNSSGITLGSDKDITLSGGGEIVGLPSAPSGATAAASKAYVDSVASGLDVKASVRLLAASNLDLAGSETIDGVATANGDRVLAIGQTDASENGIYVVAAGAWARAADADSNDDVTAGMFTFVTEGTTYQDSGWVLTTNDAIVLDTTELAFSQFSGAGSITAGAGLTKTGNTVDVVSGNAAIVVGADAITLTLESSSGLEVATNGLRIDLDSNPGLALGTGGVKVDLSTLADGSSVVDVGNDLFSFIDVSAGNVSKKGSFAYMAGQMAGVGLSSSGGVFALALSELTDTAIADGDSIVFIDASDSNASRKESLADLVSSMAGLGLSAANSVLAVSVDDSTLAISGDNVIIKDSGVVAGKIAADAVTASKFAANAVQADSNDITHLSFTLTSNATIASGAKMKGFYVDSVSGKAKLVTALNAAQAAAFVGLSADDALTAESAMNICKMSGIKISPPTAAILDNAGTSFANIGANVWLTSAGKLTTTDADIASGEYYVKVGESVSSSAMITHFGTEPVLKP